MHSTRIMVSGGKNIASAATEPALARGPATEQLPGLVAVNGRPALGKQPHLVIVVTSGLITTFFRGQIAHLCQAGFRVTFICKPGPETAAVKAEGAEVIAVPLEREIALLQDARCLWKLWRTLRRLKPDITNVGTPKAGLLGGIAARVAGVRCRIYTIHGLRLETASGWKRRLLTLTERISCANAHHVRCVGPSLRQRAIDLALVNPDKAYVVASGSSNGLDCERFLRTPERIAAAHALRRKLGIPEDSPVIGFVGRLVRDKGIRELCAAYQMLKRDFADLQLLLVGDFEEGDPVDASVRSALVADSNVHLFGMVADAAPYYPLMDVVALPTYREGFPNVPREAAAAGVPVVTTTATGAVDSVVEGITGRLVPPRDEAALAAALKDVLNAPDRGRRMGRAGEEWVRARFRQELVWDALVADYRKVLNGASARRAD